MAKAPLVLGLKSGQVKPIVARLIRLEDDPLSIWRPCSARLAIVRLAELDRPAAIGADFPKVVAPGEVGDEDDLLSVGRPRAGAGGASIEKIVHGNRVLTTDEAVKAWSTVKRPRFCESRPFLGGVQRLW